MPPCQNLLKAFAEPGNELFVSNSTICRAPNNFASRNSKQPFCPSKAMPISAEEKPTGASQVQVPSGGAARTTESEESVDHAEMKNGPFLRLGDALPTRTNRRPPPSLRRTSSVLKLQPRASLLSPSLVLNVQSLVLRTLSRSSQNSRASERRPRCHRTRNSRWPTADKSPLGPPTALLALARSGGQGRTGAVMDGQNPLALAACPPKIAKRIGGVPWTRADKMEPREQRVAWRLTDVLSFLPLGISP